MTNNHRRSLFMTIVILLTIVASLLSVNRSDIFWIAISVVNLGLMFGISRTEKENPVKWDLLKLMFIPLLLGSAGIFEIVHFGVILPIFGFMIILNLDQHSTVRVNLSFTLSFIILFSIAVSAVLGMGRFMSDLLFGTAFLRDNYDFMIGQFVTTFFAFLGAYFAKEYLRITDHNSLNNLRSEFKTGSVNLKEEFLETLRAGFEEEKRDRRLLISKFLQLGIALVVVYGILIQDLYVSILAFLIFVLGMFPYIYPWNTEREIPSVFHFWISIILFLYVMGEAAAFYSLFGISYFWWNKITHFMGGTVVAVLTYIILIYITRISDTLNLPPWLIPVLVVTFMISIGVIWELFEFIFDIIFQSNVQDHLYDTVTDIAFDMFGTSLGMPIANLFYSSGSIFSIDSKKDKS